MQEFEANTNEVDTVVVLLPKPLSVWFLRIHVVKHSPAGAGMKIELYGCTDDTATKPCKYRGYVYSVPSAFLSLPEFLRVTGNFSKCC